MGRLDVRVVSASDIHKAKDTYVRLCVEHQAHKTSVVTRCANPIFDSVFKFTVRDASSSQLMLSLWESGTLSDTELGRYRLSLAGLYQEEVWEQSVLLQSQPSNEGKIELRVRVCAVDFGGKRGQPPQPGTGNTPPAPPLQQQSGYPPHGYPPQQPLQFGPPPPQSQYPGYSQPPPQSSYYPPPQQQAPPSQYGGAYPPQQQHQSYPGYATTAGGLGGAPVAGPSPGHAPRYGGPMPAPLGGFAPPPNMDLQRPGVLPPPQVVPAGRRPQDIPEWERVGLSQLEYDHLVAMFVRFDVNDSNSLTKNELRELVRWLNYATTDSAVDRMFRDMNKSGGDTIAQKEFCAWLAYNRPDPQALYGLPQIEYNQVLAQFRACDRSRSGSISPAEFGDFCRANRWANSDAEVHRLFAEVDTQRSGRITLDEFLRWRGSKGRHLEFHVGSGVFGGSDVAQPPRAGASGIVDPNVEREAKTQQLLAFLPQLSRDQATALLRRHDWDAQMAISAALEGGM
jgi:Ca2+-binding EF-hand superfamily protein